MDAASNFKSFVVALAASIGTASFVISDDDAIESPCKSKPSQATTNQVSPCADGVCCNGQACEAGKCTLGICTSNTADKNNACCENSTTNGGIAAFVSDWLSKSPKFSAQVAIHFGAPVTQEKTVVGVFSHDEPSGPSGTLGIGGNVHSDAGLVGKFVLAERNLDLLSTKSDSNNAARVVTQIAKPMRFTERIPRIQLGELVNDVIICGHRICSGNKCYEVKDEPVKGTACDKTDDASASEDGQEEPILVLPLAPPAPPGGEVAVFDNVSLETEAASILRSSGLGNVNISVPVTTVVDLLVAKTELSTRLEMTSQLMEERQTAMQQIQSLANRNATLSTQLAVAEARNQMSEALTASVVERAELAIKLASVDTKAVKLQGSASVVQTIQEDLSNIRRQIALLRRSPVPFAQSYVGTEGVQPYVPTAQLPVSQLSKECEATCAGNGTENASTVK